MNRTIEVDTVVRDEGTIVVLAGTDLDTGQRVEFAADHRPARAIIEALNEALHDTDQNVEMPVAEVEDWQVLRVTAAA